MTRNLVAAGLRRRLDLGLSRGCAVGSVAIVLLASGGCAADGSESTTGMTAALDAVAVFLQDFAREAVAACLL